MGKKQTQGGDPRLRDLMKKMANGDSAALFCFMDEYRDDLTSTVRSILGSVGRSDAARRQGEVDFLVMSAALVVFDRAPRWQPGGAPPWLWAIRAIRGEIVQWLGHPRVEYNAELHAPADRVTQAVADIDLAALAIEHEAIATWVENVRDVASSRDQEVHLAYQTQKSLGDPSPANTVGNEFNLQPANVRQIDARVRGRLADRVALVPW